MVYTFVCDKNYMRYANLNAYSKQLDCPLSTFSAKGYSRL